MPTAVPTLIGVGISLLMKIPTSFDRNISSIHPDDDEHDDDDGDDDDDDDEHEHDDDDYG